MVATPVSIELKKNTSEHFTGTAFVTFGSTKVEACGGPSSPPGAGSWEAVLVRIADI